MFNAYMWHFYMFIWCIDYMRKSYISFTRVSHNTSVSVHVYLSSPFCLDCTTTFTIQRLKAFMWLFDMSIICKDFLSKLYTSSTRMNNYVFLNCTFLLECTTTPSTCAFFIWLFNAYKFQEDYSHISHDWGTTP